MTKERMLMLEKKKRNLLFIGVLSFLYILYVFVISPLYTLVCSNVIYLETYLPEIIEIVKEFIDLFIWAWIFAFTLLSEMDSKPGAFRYIAVPIADFLRYASALIASSLFSNADDMGAVAFYIVDSLISFGLDMIHFVLCLIIGHLLLSGLSSDKKREVLSPDAKFALKNPLVLSSLLSSSVVSLVRIGMRIRYDIFYGAPESTTDLLWIIFYYTYDLIFGFIVFILTVAITKKIIKKTSKDDRT